MYTFTFSFYIIKYTRYRDIYCTSIFILIFLLWIIIHLDIFSKYNQFKDRSGYLLQTLSTQRFILNIYSGYETSGLPLNMSVTNYSLEVVPVLYGIY
jgi:hypothetical protein